VRGLRALSVACTALNSASAMIAGPMIGICPAFGFSVSLFDQRQLNSRSATYTRCLERFRTALSRSGGVQMEATG
jgi:hypothetical protein